MGIFINLENKLKTAKQEINKIVNAKVFSRGNNLVYELDMTNRQLRFIKDSIFLMEKYKKKLAHFKHYLSLLKTYKNVGL